MSQGWIRSLCSQQQLWNGELVIRRDWNPFWNKALGISPAGVMLCSQAVCWLPVILAWHCPALRVVGAEAWHSWMSPFSSSPFLLRGEAPDPGSPGLWLGVSRPGGSQILTLEQTGTPGKAGLALWSSWSWIQPPVSPSSSWTGDFKSQLKSCSFEGNIFHPCCRSFLSSP